MKDDSVADAVDRPTTRDPKLWRSRKLIGRAGRPARRSIIVRHRKCPPAARAELYGFARARHIYGHVVQAGAGALASLINPATAAAHVERSANWRNK